MQYFITFLEGIVSFMSPCVLPLLPVFVSYFLGRSGTMLSYSGDEDGASRKSSIFYTFMKASAFVLGFTAVFTTLGVFAGAISSLISKYEQVINVVCGVIVIVLGISVMDIIKLPHLRPLSAKPFAGGIVPAFVFGALYSVMIAPCAGAFLGSALMMAASSGTTLKGALLLLCYSMGFGLPFIISALAIDKIEGAFTFVKKHYQVIKVISGLFLIMIGMLMATGMIGKWMRLVS